MGRTTGTDIMLEAVVAMLEPAGLDIVALYTDAAEDTAVEFVPEPEDIKAEMSSWPKNS